jgi:hypothetical protein
MIDNVPLSQFALKMYKNNYDFGQYVMDIFTSISFKNTYPPTNNTPPQLYPSQVIGLKKFITDINDINISEKLLD